ncbi:MAG TPA: MauE/DoxX family redox-associated membrane protein, partial [Stackebrandtia sp.]|uniref:MauE/DoxX family redox-associated membrane protein n=1 Tax=Stackebrandtia sp. TaxID=2023065 RepID=UPI002D4A680B
MWQWIAAVQAVPLAAVLLWAAWVKLFTVRGKVAAQDTALKRLVGEERAALAYRVLGGCEAALGIWLLAPAAGAARAVAACALTAGFGGY